MSEFYQSCNHFPHFIHFTAPDWQEPVLKVFGFQENKKYGRHGINY